MTTYTTNGMRSIRSNGLELAQGQIIMIFGNRMAKKSFGRRGECVLTRVNAWSQDGSIWECEIFIGTKNGSGWNGRNVQFTVNVQ